MLFNFYKVDMLKDVVTFGHYICLSLCCVAAEILAGSILFENNNRLCFINTILWSDVLTNKRSNHSMHPSSPPATCNYLFLYMTLLGFKHHINFIHLCCRYCLFWSIKLEF